MAIKAPVKDEKIDGILVSKGFEFNILSPEDLTDLTNLTTSSLTQSLTLPFRPHPSLLLLHLRQMWGQRGVKEVERTKGRSRDESREFNVYDAITITWHRRKGQGRIELEWEGGDPAHDGMADAALALILGIESSPASVKVSHTPCKGHGGHSDPKVDEVKGEVTQEEMEDDSSLQAMDEEKVRKMRKFLEARYDQVDQIQEEEQEEEVKEEDKEENKENKGDNDLDEKPLLFQGPNVNFNISLDGLSATVRMKDYSVKAKDKAFERKIQRVVSHLARSVEPIRPL